MERGGHKEGWLVRSYKKKEREKEEAQEETRMNGIGERREKDEQQDQNGDEWGGGSGYIEDWTCVLLCQNT